MRRKGRKIRSFEAAERRQYQPGELANALDPALRRQIEDLAVSGYAAQGRGLLLVQIDAASEAGILSSEYYSGHKLAELGRAVPFAEEHAAMTAVQGYDPEREYVVLVLDVTATLAHPQLWLDVVPRLGQGQASAEAPVRKSASRKQGQTSDTAAVMASAYAIIEALAREGYAEQGRGFVFYGAYADGETEPYVAYLTLERPPGDGFAASAPDLVAYVRTYDPKTSFVIFDAVINLDGEQLEQVKIDVWTFMAGVVVPSA